MSIFLSKRRMFLVIMVIVLAMVLSACKKGSIPIFNMLSSEEDATRALKLATYAPDTLNPLLTQNNSTAQMLNLAFEPLVWCDNSGNPLPILAERWVVSDDNKTISIKLRENVAMHDGNIMTQADVIYSLNLVRNNEKSVYHARLDNVENISSIGSYEIKITLKTPQPMFVNLLEIPIVKANLKEQPLNPIGTGCYRYDNQATKKQISFVAFDSWWNADKPMISKVNFIIMDDIDAPLFAFDADEVDAISVDLANISKITTLDNATVVEVTTAKLAILGLNNSRSIFKSAEMRRALAFAINKHKLVSDIFLERAEVTSTFINPLWSVYAPNLEYGFDTNITRATLEHNVTGAFKILVNDSNDINVSAAQFIANNLYDIGIDAKVERVPIEAYNSRIQKGEYDAFLGNTMIAKDGNAQFLLAGEMSQFLKYDNAKMQERLVSWANQTTSEGQESGYYYIQKQYLADMPFISLYFEDKVMAFSPDLVADGGFTPIEANVYYGINKWSFGE